MKYKTRYVLFGKMKGVEYFMKLPDQLKDIVYEHKILVIIYKKYKYDR